MGAPLHDIKHIKRIGSTMTLSIETTNTETKNYRARDPEKRDYSTTVRFKVTHEAPGNHFILFLDWMRDEVADAVYKVFEPLATHPDRSVKVSTHDPSRLFHREGYEVAVQVVIPFAKPSDILEDVSLEGVEAELRESVTWTSGDAYKSAVEGVEAMLSEIATMPHDPEVRDALDTSPNIGALHPAYGMLGASLSRSWDTKKLELTYQFNLDGEWHRELYAKLTLRETPDDYGIREMNEHTTKLDEGAYFESYVSASTSSSHVTIQHHQRKHERMSRYLKTLAEAQRRLERIARIAKAEGLTLSQLYSMLGFRWRQLAIKSYEIHSSDVNVAE